MRHARSLITTLIGLAIWSVAATTTAYAALPDPARRLDGVVDPPIPPTPDPGSFWQYALVAAIAALLAVAVVGLIASLRHSRAERPSSMLHA